MLIRGVEHLNSLNLMNIYRNGMDDYYLSFRSLLWMKRWIERRILIQINTIRARVILI